MHMYCKMRETSKTVAAVFNSQHCAIDFIFQTLSPLLAVIFLLFWPACSISFSYFFFLPFRLIIETRRGAFGKTHMLLSPFPFLTYTKHAWRAVWDHEKISKHHV